jgi:hypothetical protein
MAEPGGVRSPVERSARGLCPLGISGLADQQGQRYVTAQLAIPGAPQLSIGLFVDAELGE